MAKTKQEDDFDTFADGGEDSLMVNLSDVEESSFEAFKAGLYPVVLEKCEFQISKSSQMPMWNCMFSITEGEFENRKLFTYMSFSPKALPMTKANIRAMGLTELLDGAFDPKAIADEGTIVGSTAMAKVGIEKDNNDEDRNVIKTLKPSVESTDAFG